MSDCLGLFSSGWWILFWQVKSLENVCEEIQIREVVWEIEIF